MHSDAFCDLWSPFHFLLQKWNFLSFFEMKCRPVPTGPIGAMPVTRTASSVLRLPPKQTWASLPMILTLWHRSLIVQYWFIHGNWFNCDFTNKHWGALWQMSVSHKSEPHQRLRCFLEQETLPSLLSTGLFQEWIRAWLT